MTIYKAELITDKPNTDPHGLKELFWNGKYKNLETITTETEEEFLSTIGIFATTHIGKHSKKAFVLFTDSEYFILNNLWLIHYSNTDREYKD